MTSPAPLDDRVGAMLRALAEPRRRAILRLVATTERAAGEIAAEFEVSRTAVRPSLASIRSTIRVTGAGQPEPTFTTVSRTPARSRMSMTCWP